MKYTKTNIYFTTNGESTDKATNRASSILDGVTLSKFIDAAESQGKAIKEDTYSLTLISVDPKEAEIKELALYIKDVYKLPEIWVTQEIITNTIY